METVEREIDELESRETTYRVCERLAWLYVVKDHLAPSGEATTEDMRGSEFLEAASGVSYRALMSVLDEHVQALSLLQPKSYDALMSKIRALRR